MEKLLGIEDQITERANTIRVLMMELNRISSHLVWLATTGMELGALSMMIYGFREREYILDIFEMITGLRMNMAYIRPGRRGAGRAATRRSSKIREFLDFMPKRLKEYEDLLSGQPIWHERTKGVARARRDRLPGARHHRPGAALAPAWPGTCARRMPYCGYETYEFDVPTATDRRRVGPLPGPARRDAASR